jgi:hypothetical protein
MIAGLDNFHFRIEPVRPAYIFSNTKYPRAANRPCDRRHQKRECDTNFFVCLLVHRCRIDALAPAASLFAPLRVKDSAMRNEHSGAPGPTVPPPHSPKRESDAMAADRPLDTAAMLALIALIGMIVFLLGT